MTRCPAALWLARHELRWTQRRDAAGRAVVPHTLIWTCARCGAALGTTTLAARGPLEGRGAVTVIGDEIPVRGRSRSCEKPSPRLRVLKGAR